MSRTNALAFFPFPLVMKKKKVLQQMDQLAVNKMEEKVFFYLMVKMFQNFLSLSPKVLKVEK